MQRRKTAGILTVKGINRIKILFPFDTTTLDNVRSLTGRTWHPKTKYWSAALTLDNVKALESWGFLVDSLIPYVTTKKSKSIKIQGLKGKLFDYQTEGVQFIEDKGGSGLIADEMGLGKTIQALAYLQLHPELRPAIIVCPASLKLNWEIEIRKWMGSVHTFVINGTKPTTVKAEIYIINYDIVKAWEKHLTQLGFKAIVLDEAHYIKNNKAQRTKATMRLAKSVPNKILLTGTPIESRPSELYNLTKILDPLLFSNKWDYLMKYCGAKHNGFGWDFNGASKIEELHKILTSTIMIRRKKKDVLKDLPDKLYSFIPIELDNRKEYREAEKDFISFVKGEVDTKARKIVREYFDEYGAPIMVDEVHLQQLKDEKGLKAEEGGALYRIEILKQLAVKGKMKQVIQWIDNFLESGEKLVLFANHKFVITELMEHYKNIAVKIDGSVSIKNRQKAVDDFQGSKVVRLFIGNIKAAGVGITLTAASHVAILEYPWAPSQVSQAIDRCHRIGQKNTVNVHYLYSANTIEEYITRMLHDKQNVVDAVLDGKSVGNFNLLADLINNFK